MTRCCGPWRRCALVPGGSAAQAGTSGTVLIDGGGSAAVSIWGNRYTYETVLLSRSTPQARVLAFSYTYSVVGRIPAAVLQVRDASRNGAPVCVDAFTVLR